MDILKTPQEERDYIVGLFNQLFEGESNEDAFTGTRSLVYEIYAFTNSVNWRADWALGGAVVFSATNGIVRYSFEIGGELLSRDKDSYQCLFLTKDKKRFKLTGENIERIDEDTYRIVIPNEIAEAALTDGTKISLRADNDEVVSELYFGIKSPARVFKLVAGCEVDDDEIDEIYDDCAASMEDALKSQDEESEKTAQMADELDYYSRVVSCCRHLIFIDPEDDSIIEPIIKNPDSVSAVSALREYCSTNNITCDLLEFIDSFGKSDYAQAMLKEEDRIKEETNKRIINKKRGKTFTFVAIGCFLLSFVNDTIQPVFIGLAAVMLIVSVACRYIGNKEVEPNLKKKRAVAEFRRRMMQFDKEYVDKKKELLSQI